MRQCRCNVCALELGSRRHLLTGACTIGADTPDYLEDLPGSFGFDPLGLGSVPSNLQRFRESEVIHSRWAMAGAAGVIAVELLGQGNWYDAPLWVSSSSPVKPPPPPPTHTHTHTPPHTHQPITKFYWLIMAISPAVVACGYLYLAVSCQSHVLFLLWARENPMLECFSDSARQGLHHVRAGHKNEKLVFVVADDAVI